MKHPISSTATIPPILRKIIYGVRLANTPAVDALELYHGLLGKWGQYYGPENLFDDILKYEEQLKGLIEENSIITGREGISISEAHDARFVMKPLREALCRGDAQFFLNLGEAIEKRKKAPHQAALFIHEYLWNREVFGECEEALTITELSQKMIQAGHKGNVSKILKDELGIEISTDPRFRKGKPGRKTRL